MTPEANASELDASILVATRDRAPILRETLARFERLDLGGARWELIVVDNGSKDGTPALLEAARGALPITVLREPEPGKNRAMNLALPRARGALLVFTDDDVVPGPRWPADLLAASRRWPEHGVFGGPVTPVYPPEAPEWLREHKFSGDAFSRFFPSDVEGPSERLPLGPNYAVRATWMAGRRFSEEIGSRGGAFDPLGGETELLRRLRAAGARVVFVPTAGVGHLVDLYQTTLPWLFRRSFRLGRTAVRLEPDVGSRRIFGAPARLWSRLLRGCARFQWARIRGERARFEAGLRLYKVRGQMYEHLARTRDPKKLEWLLP